MCRTDMLDRRAGCAANTVVSHMLRKVWHHDGCETLVTEGFGHTNMYVCVRKGRGTWS